MKNHIKLLIIGLVAFLVFLVATAPASILSSIVSSSTGISFTQVSGTIWHGQARQVGTNTAQIGPIEWSLHAWRLLTGELSATVNIKRGLSNDYIEGIGRFGLGVPGVLSIHDGQFLADAEWAFSQAALPIVASGQLDLKIDELRLRSGKLPEITAELIWQNAGVSYPQSYDLGSYIVQIQNEAESEQLLARISDNNSPLHIKGQATLVQSGDYQLDVNVKAENHAPEDITRLLPILGTTQKDGSVNVTHKGQLKELF